MENSISKTIESNSKLVFVPNKFFYQETRINKKRWGQLYRGEKEPLLSEVKSISNFFNISVEKFL